MFGKIIRSRLHHWSCSKFADLIRGTKKPYALEWDKWDDWDNKQKQERPWRFWLSDTILPKIQNIVYFPYDIYTTVRIYIRNRFYDKTHYLNTGLSPGNYYELDYRILHGLFNELVDFVEKDLSHLTQWDTTKKYKFKNGRCIEAAYDYFKWSNNLKNKGKLTEQAKSSRKIQKLYEWWKNTRPNRISPYSDPAFDTIDNEKSHVKRKLYDKAYKTEQEQDDEDTEMLIELIKIRNHLWI
jgi:hypothetical protein